MVSLSARLKIESSSMAAHLKQKKRPIYSPLIARQHPLAHGLLLMQNACPSPSSCLPASGERPFNRTCVPGLKKKRDKASKHADSISFFCFRFTTPPARRSPLPQPQSSSPLLSFLFPTFLFFCLFVNGASGRVLLSI